jgi:hypothetical protein
MKEELKKDYDIDYSKFIKSRHSARSYKNWLLKWKISKVLLIWQNFLTQLQKQLYHNEFLLLK